MVVFVEGFNVVEEAFGEAGSFADEINELVGDAWKGSAEIKQYDSWELVKGRSVVGARLFQFWAREIDLTGGGISVAYSGTSVDVYDVVKTMSAAYEAVLFGGVGPFGDGVRDDVVDSRSDGLIVGVFEAERPSVFS